MQNSDLTQGNYKEICFWIYSFRGIQNLERKKGNSLQIFAKRMYSIYIHLQRNAVFLAKFCNRCLLSDKQFRRNFSCRSTLSQRQSNFSALFVQWIEVIHGAELLFQTPICFRSKETLFGWWIHTSCFWANPGIENYPSWPTLQNLKDSYRLIQYFCYVLKKVILSSRFLQWRHGFLTKRQRFFTLFQGS